MDKTTKQLKIWRLIALLFLVALLAVSTLYAVGVGLKRESPAPVVTDHTDSPSDSAENGDPLSLWTGKKSSSGKRSSARTLWHRCLLPLSSRHWLNSCCRCSQHSRQATTSTSNGARTRDGLRLPKKHDREQGKTLRTGFHAAVSGGGYS